MSNPIIDITDIKLDPCPFCGGHARICSDFDKNGDEYKVVECQECEATGSPSDCYLSYNSDIDEIEESISTAKKWNSRK